MQTETRRLQDLVSIGPAMLRDLRLLQIRSVAQLARKNPRRMYRDLCRLRGRPQDICCLDVFTATVAQAKNPQLPVEQCQWWYWSRKRKAESQDVGTAGKVQVRVIGNGRKQSAKTISVMMPTAARAMPSGSICSGDG
jgi:hypothetical protein